MQWNLIIYSNTLWLLLLIFWTAAAPFAKRIIQQEPTLIWLAQMTAFVVAMYLLIFPPLPLPWLNQSLSPTNNWLGAAIVTFGMAIVVWARITLGRNWSSSSAVKQDHELIKTGPYGLVRHPIYTGLSFAILGSAFQHCEVRSLLAVIICAVGFLSRIRAEEHLLLQQFPTTYPTYQDEVPAFLPF